jgi:hypothetical protein
LAELELISACPLSCLQESEAAVQAAIAQVLQQVAPLQPAWQVEPQFCVAPDLVLACLFSYLQGLAAAVAAASAQVLQQVAPLNAT